MRTLYIYVRKDVKIRDYFRRQNGSAIKTFGKQWSRESIDVGHCFGATGEYIGLVFK